MGGADGQLALDFTPKIGRQGADIAGFQQHLAGPGDDFHTGRGDCYQAAALAQEELEAQLVFQLLELLGQARLGGVHQLGRLGDIESGIGNRDQIAQLGQGHGRAPSARDTC